MVQQEILARNYGLMAQLDSINYCHLCKERVSTREGDEPMNSMDSSPRWVLADLSRDKIQSLQKAQGEKEIGQSGWQGFLEEASAALPTRIELYFP